MVTRFKDGSYTQSGGVLTPSGAQGESSNSEKNQTVISRRPRSIDRCTHTKAALSPSTELDLRHRAREVDRDWGGGEEKRGQFEREQQFACISATMQLHLCDNAAASKAMWVHAAVITSSEHTAFT